MKKGKIMVMACTLAVTAATLTGIRAETAYAVEGWLSENGEWKYLDQDDAPVLDTWRQSKDAWFYLGPDGTMRRESFIERGNGLYYVDADGKRVENGWILNTEADDSGHEAGWYYFDENGKAYRRTTSSFKKTIDGKTYVFDENGRMLTGWIDTDGNSLSEDGNFPVEGEYYADTDGALKKEYWLNDSNLQTDEIEDLTSEISGRNYDEYDQIWMYFDDHGKKVKGKDDRLKQMTIDGNTYGFDEYGIMLPWWSKVASVSDADKNNPTTEEPAKFFAGYDGGYLLKNVWLWMYPSENLMEEDYNDGEYSWWRTDQNGKVYSDKIALVNNNFYAFDGLGRMQTGFALFDTRSTFVAQYDSDVWSSEAFKNGDLYGDEKADLYFFSPDELNDGSMQTGKEVEIELEDGIYTFGFGSNGIAYGSRNNLRRVKDTFYINGLRLEADEEYRYGVVQEVRDEEEIYRVVDANGKVVSGEKKVVKDGDGGWLIIINDRFVARVGDQDKPKWRTGTEGTGFYHYDSSNKEDKYAGGMIAGSSADLSLDGLLDEEKLNF